MKIISRFLEEELVEPEEIRELLKDYPPGYTEFLNALVTLKRNNRVMHDFYIFNNIIKALNYEQADFENFSPVNAEQMWNGINIIHKLFPEIEFIGEASLFIKAVLNNEGIYFYPNFIEKSRSLHDIIEKSESGPFPLKADDTLSIQASKYLVLKTYHEIESSKDFSWLKNINQSI